MAATHPGPAAIPQAGEAERALIGAMLLDPDVLATVSAVVEAGDFHGYKVRSVFEAMITIVRAGGRTDDPVAVQAEAERHGMQFHLADLVALSDGVPTTSLAMQHAKLVRDASVRRSILTLTSEMREQLATESTEAVIEAAQVALALLALRLRRP